jgi:lipopolysaccharide assembly outer membrane protein LptD (OstA)
MKASGSVIIQAVNGRKINAESILYEGKTKMFSSQESVQITYPEGDIIKGIGFRADSELNKVEIFQVTGITSQ